MLKFRGAGQGVKVLIAELLAGEIGRALGLPVPEIVFAELDPVLGRSEPDPEIRDLINASPGLNLGIDFLPGSFAFEPALKADIDSQLASDIVWLDAYLTNVDRTARNPNLLVWHKRLWLIDHGASLYFHFAGPDYAARAANPFPEIRSHVLLRRATELREADARLAARLDRGVIDAIVGQLPDDWLDDPAFTSPRERRAAYAAYLWARARPPRLFVEEALNAHAQLV